MRLPLVVFVTFATLGYSAPTPTPPKKVDDAPKPKIVGPPDPTPAPKRSVLGRIFGGKPTPAPTPAPTPTPVAKPKPRLKPKAKPAEADETPSLDSLGNPVPPKKKPGSAKAGTDHNGETDADGNDVQPPPKKKPDGDKPSSDKPPAPATETPAGDKPATDAPAGDKPAAGDKPPTETPAADTLPPKPGKNGKAGKNAKNQPKAAKPVETVVLDDATKYKNAHTTALEDEKIKDLKNKADNAVDDADAHKASVTYNKALFRKIREIDGSLDSYVDRLEAAMMKRLDAEKH